MKLRRIDRAAMASFEPARAIGLSLCDVEAATRYDGAPILRAGGRFMAGLAAHPSAEPATLVVRFDPQQRAGLLEDAPDTYYITDYYRSHPVVLVRLSRIDRNALRDLMTMSRGVTVATRAELDRPAGTRRRCARTVHTPASRGRR